MTGTVGLGWLIASLGVLLTLFPTAAVARGPADGPLDAAIGGDQAEPGSVVEWPSTPAGERAAWLLTLVGEGGEALPAPWPLVFGEGVLAQLPLGRLEEWAGPKRSVWGGLRVLGWVNGNDEDGKPIETVLIALVQGAADGSGWRLSVAVDPEPPHLVIAWQFEPDMSATRPREYRSLDDLRADLDRTGLAYGLTLYDVTEHTPIRRGEPRPVFAIHGDRLLNISTGIRWVVMGALAERVRGSMLTWNEPVMMDARHYSLPPGDARLVPPGEELPLSTLMMSMITASDNTATDHLMARLGQATLDEYFSARVANPDANRPLLNTMQLFRLKVGASEDPILAYSRAASVEERRRILGEQVPGNEVAEALYMRWAVPQYVETVGWFMSAEELSGVLREVRWRSLFPGMEIMRTVVRSGAESEVPQDDRWDKVVVRVEGEPGVIAFMGMLERADGREYLLVLIANNPLEGVNTALLSPVLDGLMGYLGGLDPEAYPVLPAR